MWNPFGNKPCPSLIETRIDNLEKQITKIMADQTALDAAIAALPSALETALTTALQPIIAAIEAKSSGTPVSAEVATAVTPAS